MDMNRFVSRTIIAIAAAIALALPATMSANATPQNGDELSQYSATVEHQETPYDADLPEGMVGIRADSRPRLSQASPGAFVGSTSRFRQAASSICLSKATG